MIDFDRIAYALRTDEIERLRRLPYPEYLRSDWWAWKRKQAIKRAGGRCELCRNTARWLEVHHTTYANLGRERNSDLVTLCHNCHDHIKANGLDRLTRHELLSRRREIMHSPEFQRSTRERLEY
jgi:hypothetical protein